MTKLNQIIAVEKSVRATKENALTQAYHTIQKAPLFAGIVKTYQPKDEEGDQLPGDKQLVQQNVEQVIDDLVDPIVRLIDLTVTKDTNNGVAVADIRIGDRVLAAKVPVTTLLWLEKQIVDYRTFVSKLPVLDPETHWTENPQTGLYESDPIQTVRQKKVAKFITTAPATDKHAAQVVRETEDVIEGMWTTVRLSGAITSQRKADLLAKVTLLAEAVKVAREEANSMTVTDVKIGAGIVAYLFE